MNQDEEHLRLLSIFHYVVGGLAALFSCFPFIHVAMGLLFVFMPEKMSSKGDMPPALFGWFFVILGSVIILIGWTLAICILLTGRFLAKRKRYLYCFVLGCVECLFMPFGTVLGVFTIMVLNRPSVKQLFGVPNPGC